LIYSAHASGAEIYPSIGGWTLSGSFPTVAADVDKRRRFARECVGLIEDYGFDEVSSGFGQ
jgi:chitinase